MERAKRRAYQLDEHEATIIDGYRACTPAEQVKLEGYAMERRWFSEQQYRIGLKVVEGGRA